MPRPRVLRLSMPTDFVPGEIVPWGIAGLYAALLVVAAVSDIRVRLIPNWVVLAIIATFVPWLLFNPDVSLLSSLEAGAIAFGIGVVLYALKFVGAGDSKLAGAVALFVGLEDLPQFGLIMVLAGGVLAVINLASNPTRAYVIFQTRGRGDPERGVPYGVAIALAGLVTMLARFAGGLPALMSTLPFRG
jgi:prepilin peptidase CpaA